MSGYRVGSECYPNADEALGAYWREMGAEWGKDTSVGAPNVIYYAVFADVYPPVFLRQEISAGGVLLSESYQTVPVIGLPECDVVQHAADIAAGAEWVVGGMAGALAFALGLGWALRGRYGY